MPLIIGTHSFSGELTPTVLEQISKSLSSLPEPEVIPYHESKADPDAMVISLQREIAKSRLHLSGSSFRYFGTKYLRTCIQVTLYNAVEIQTIHWDHVPYTGLIKDLAAFSGDRIYVSLVGGKTDSQSQKTLNSILSELYKAAQATGKTLIIQNHLLLERNVFTEVDKPRFIYFYIKHKISDFFRLVYGKAVPETFFSNFNLESFSKRLGLKGIDSELLITYIATMIFNTRIIFTPENYKKFISAYTLLSRHYDGSAITPDDVKSLSEIKISDSPKPFIDEEGFLKLMGHLFTKEGYNFFFNQLNKTPTAYSDVKLENFVFDRVTQRYIIIDARFVVPSEEMRAAALNDYLTIEKYHLYHDSLHEPLNHLPYVSKPFLEKIHTCTTNAFKFGGVLSDTDRTKIREAFHLADNGHELHFLQAFLIILWAKSYPDLFMNYQTQRGSLLENQPSKILTRLPDSLLAKGELRLADCYKPDEFKEETTTSAILKKLTGQSFTLKLRTAPAWTLDAILPERQLTNPKILASITKFLRMNDIAYTVINFSDLGKCLCIEAINIRANALKIQKASQNIAAEVSTSAPKLVV